MPLRVAFPPLSTRPAPGLSSQAGCRLTANELHCQVAGTACRLGSQPPAASYAHQRLCPLPREADTWAALGKL